MKKFFVMTLAIATLASCSKVETINPGNQSKIGFDNAFVDNSTKALITTQNISKFMVYGTQNGSTIFDGVAVSKLNNDWEYEGARYWQRNSTYKFAAIAPAVHGLTNIQYTDNLPISGTYTLANTHIDGQTDLLYDGIKTVTVDQTYPNSPVQFSFKHMLSKVSFKFENSYATSGSYTILIKDLKIAAKSSATVTFANKTWTDHTGDTNLSFTINNGIKIEEGAYGTSHDSLIIPAPGNTYTITGSAEIYYNNNLINTVTYNQLIAEELKAGYHYTINSEIGQGETHTIRFSAEVEDEWTVGTTADLGYTAGANN